MGISMPAVQNELVCLPPPSTGTVLSVQVCRTWAELAEFCDGWNSLLQACSTASIFQTPEWLGAWWQAFGANKELLGLVFTDTAENLAGIALFYADQERFPAGTKRPLKVLRLVGAGSGDSDALDFITAPGYEQCCAEAFLRWLAGNNSWDVCALETLPQESLAGRHISRLAQERGWKPCAEAPPNFYISLPPTWGEYLRMLEPGFRPLLTRYPKRLHSRYRVSMERCQRPQELDRCLQTLFALHQMRWTGRGEPGAFLSAERRDFYSLMANAFLKRGWLEFWLLKLEDKIVATQFCFRYGNTVSLLQEGFDPQYTSDRVGYALRAHVLQEMIGSGATRYDFLGGADAYKLKFGAHQQSYLTVRFAGSPRGRLHLTLGRRKQQIKAWLKRKLPAPLLAALRGKPRASAGAQQSEAAE
jgi:CelD/BcsL family acetyltransferase involved in cellulose biosynthesis